MGRNQTSAISMPNNESECSSHGGAANMMAAGDGRKCIDTRRRATTVIVAAESARMHISTGHDIVSKAIKVSACHIGAENARDFAHIRVPAQLHRDAVCRGHREKAAIFQCQHNNKDLR